MPIRAKICSSPNSRNFWGLDEVETDCSYGPLDVTNVTFDAFYAEDVFIGNLIKFDAVTVLDSSFSSEVSKKYKDSYRKTSSLNSFVLGSATFNDSEKQSYNNDITVTDVFSGNLH